MFIQWRRLVLGVVFAFSTLPINAKPDFIVLQSTTSTQNSGLYEYLLPLFEAETGIEVRVVAVGTGQAIKNAKNCDADVLLVHAKASEERFVSDGYGVKRTDLMYNDFVIVGPESDPAGINGLKDVVQGLQTIANKGMLFASRGDDSGTNKKELDLWQSAGVDVKKVSGSWYRETGSGMGATLNIALGLGAYTLTDRATWIAFANKGNFRILLEGDSRLFNQYGVVSINSSKCPNVKEKQAEKFIAWLLSADGQEKIGRYTKSGQQLFFPNAPK
jgi:tungstate transport system substrate-binding protein